MIGTPGIDPLTINEGHRYEDMTENAKKNDDLLFLEISSYRVTSSCEMTRSGNHVFIVEKVPVPLKHQAHTFKRYKPVAIAVDDKIIKLKLENPNVAINDGLTKEISLLDLEKCKLVEGNYICLLDGGTFQKPGRGDCVSMIALNRTLEEIAKSFKWMTKAEDDRRIEVTKVEEDTYMIASLRETSVAIDCENKEEVEYKALGRGNTEIHIGVGCQVKETRLNPDFLILPSSTSSRKVF